MASADRVVEQYLEIVRAVRGATSPEEAIRRQPSWILSESAFVAHAAAFSARTQIERATWREFGVADAVLARAGIAD